MKIKKLSPDAIIPTKGSKEAAGLDLYALSDVTIPSGKMKKVCTGIAVAIPDGYFGGIYARSGLATKAGLRLANDVGIIDSDYRGEVIVALYNDSTEMRTISKGDRVAQLIIQPYEKVEIEEVTNLDSTDRGEGGFGSSGK